MTYYRRRALADNTGTDITNTNPLRQAPATDTESWAAQTTTNTYADLGSAWDKTKVKSATLVIKNEGGGGNAAHVKVLGSVDGTNYDVEILAETSVAGGAVREVNIANYYTHVKIQVKAAVANSQTDVSAKAAAIAA